MKELWLNEGELLKTLGHVVGDLAGFTSIGGDGPQVACPLVVHVGVEDTTTIRGPTHSASGLIGVKPPVDSLPLGQLHRLSSAVIPDLHHLEAPVPVGHVGYPLAVRGEVGVVLVLFPFGEEGGLAGTDIYHSHPAPVGTVRGEDQLTAVGGLPGPVVVVVEGVGGHVAGRAAVDWGYPDVHALEVSIATSV